MKIAVVQFVDDRGGREVWRAFTSMEAAKAAVLEYVTNIYRDIHIEEAGEFEPPTIEYNMNHANTYAESTEYLGFVGIIEIAETNLII